MKAIRFFLPRLEYVLLIAVFWSIIASGPRILNFDGDLPRHLLNGRLILQDRHVATTDMFSFRTTGYRSFPHEWLSQTIFAVVYGWLELDGVVLLTALIITLTWARVYGCAVRRSNSLLLTLTVLVLGIAASQIHVLPRPHIFSYLFTVIWISLLERVTLDQGRHWWIVPLVMLVWVNLHGMFVLGILILVIYLIGDFLDQRSGAWFTTPRTKSLALAGAFSLLATFVSPSGPRIWETIASLGSNSYITSRIPEYQSPNFHLPETWPFILLLLLTLVGFARATEKASWKDILLTAAFAGFALYSSRMIPLFALVVTPLAAKVLGGWLRADYPGSRLWISDTNLIKINSASNGLIWVVAVVVLAAMTLRSGGTLDPQGRGNVFDQRFFPVEAATWLETHSQEGRMFNEFDWGGYLLFRLWPAQQVFMDGHTHIYGESLTREYEQVIMQTEGWEDILDTYQVQWVIMRKQAPLVKALLARDDWAIVYEDTTAVILIRR
ncbi:MAG TPA: hypothetical protein VK900_12950 [Anaerolineales bacterium]|nr:hypothetical protein [Anaerolineales bacterium]